MWKLHLRHLFFYLIAPVRPIGVVSFLALVLHILFSHLDLVEFDKQKTPLRELLSR